MFPLRNRTYGFLGPGENITVPGRSMAADDQGLNRQ